MSNVISGLDSSSGAPSAHMTDDYRLGWAKEALQEADGYLRSQRLFDRIERTNQMLLGVTMTLRGALGLSDTQCNYLYHIFKKKAADYTDIRPSWRYETFNRAFELQARNLGNLSESWWMRSQSGRQLNLTVKQSLVSASGVNHIRWDRDDLDFAMPAKNPLDVKPIRPRDVSTFQKCLAVAIAEETTVNGLREQFPKYAHKIVMDRDASITGLAARTSYVPQTMSVGEAAAWAEGTVPNSKLGALPVVDMFHMYIDDRSRNDTGDTILMGDWDRRPDDNLVPLNHWSYEVKPGERRYPFKRLMIFTRSCVLYDGPSPYWHGLFPVAKFTPQPYMDFWLGISPLWSCLDLQESLNKLYRGIDDHFQVFLKPPVSGDRRSMAPAEMANLDPRRPGQRWLRNPGQAEMKRVEVPVLDPSFFTQRQNIMDDMDRLAGTRDLSAVLGLNQTPEGESLDKLMSSFTPESRMESRELESWQTEIGTMMSYNFPEFYDEPRVFEILGEDGLTPELYDFDPGTLVPAYTGAPFFAPHGREGNAHFDPETGQIVERHRSDVDLRPRWQRAREAFRKLRFKVEPGSLKRSANIEDQLRYMMLHQQKALPRYDLWEKLDIPGIGPRPKGTMQERLHNEMLEDAEIAGKAQLLASPMGALGAAMGGGAMGGGMGGGMGGPPAPGAPNPLSAPEGRPNSFEEPPHREGMKNSTS